MEAVNRRDDATVLTEFTRFTEQGEAYCGEVREDAAAQEAQREETADLRHHRDAAHHPRHHRGLAS